MGTRVAIVGAGAIGGQAGAAMARAGEDVTLIDMWPENVEHMRRHGMQLTGMSPQETYATPVNAMHVSDVQSLAKQRPIDVAFIAVKSYDTVWATMLIKPYLAPDGFVVSLQNCINEERIAGVVGWGKTLGVVIAVLAAELVAPGHVKRHVRLHDSPLVIFRAGEIHGRVTERAEEVARLLRPCAASKVTTNLWGERWSKLVINSIRNGLSAVTGFGGNERESNDLTRWIGIKLGSEAIRVGQALGFELEPIFGLPAETLARAGEGDKDSLEQVTRVLLADAGIRSDEQRPSMAQDIYKGRRTEVDDINGFIVQKGEEIGVSAPTHAKINDLVKKVERGEIAAGIENVRDIVAMPHAYA